MLSDAAGVDPGTPLQAPFEAPALRRFSTPDCMSSPVSYLRDMTHGLEEGVRRERAAQFLLESRLAHLQQRRLYLVLDLDETLVHSLRSSVRQVDGELGDLHAHGNTLIATLYHAAKSINMKYL